MSNFLHHVVTRPAKPRTADLGDDLTVSTDNICQEPGTLRLDIANWPEACHVDLTSEQVLRLIGALAQWIAS